jgi:hypothetical protein
LVDVSIVISSLTTGKMRQSLLVKGSFWYDFTGLLAASCIQFQVFSMHFVEQGTLQGTLHFTLLGKNGNIFGGRGALLINYSIVTF